MTLLYYDPRFLDHQTGSHPESPRRLRDVVSHLELTGLDKACARPPWDAVSQSRLALVHSPQYAPDLLAFENAGGGYIESDTVLRTGSVNAARLAAGAASDAVERVVRGEDTNALCLVRPPGHHALRDSAMGFCLFNNVAVAARVAANELELDRVLVVDWDVHHGNGTQDAFYSDPQVAFFSIHRSPFYPGTGAAGETGSGPGLGRIANVPVKFGTPRDEYHAAFRSALASLADKIRPQMVIISAGFDSHREDPVGSLGLEIEDFIDLTRAVIEVADQHAQGRVISVLEGGYNPPVLANCVEVHLRELLAATKNRSK